jgi:low temperature requirement protein LtrA
MTKKSVFRKAELNKYSDQKEERKVSWLELYFDLFFVVVLYYLVHELAYDFSLHNLFQYTLMFLSSLWLWMSYTYYKEVFQNHGLEIRIFTFFYMIPIASLAVFSSDFMDNNLTYYILSYAIARLMLSAAWIH